MDVASFVLTAAQLGAIVDHAQRELPNEACGILGGPPGRLERVYPMDNMLRSPVEYQIEPTEQVRVMLEIEALGWDVCGIFHSHPAGPARPSATDVSRAYYPDAVYLIASPAAAGGWQVRGFQIDSGRVREVPLIIAE